MANPQAHYDVTAPEIWEQTGGAFDAFCDFAGTGGKRMVDAAGVVLIRVLRALNLNHLQVTGLPEMPPLTVLMYKICTKMLC